METEGGKMLPLTNLGYSHPRNPNMVGKATLNTTANLVTLGFEAENWWENATLKTRARLVTLGFEAEKWWENATLNTRAKYVLSVYTKHNCTCGIIAARNGYINIFHW